KEFASYHLPDDSFLYLLHAMKATERNARRVIDSPDWRMYLLDSGDVEREVLRLHQFHRLSYEAAGTLATLDLPADSPAAYAEPLRDIVFIVRAAALFPVYRTSSLLEQLKGKVHVPAVLFYPGELDGAAGLRFMGVSDAEHNYRPKIF